jgi:hypothetical protein
MLRIFLVAAFSLVSTAVAPAAGPTLDESGFRQRVVPFFAKHCVECHGSQQSDGDLKLHDVRLADFAAGESVTTWANILERLATGNMPPADHPQPGREETARVVLWIRDQLLVVGHGVEFAFPEKGNQVPHEVLFGDPAEAAKQSLAAATPARVWRISPYQYDGLFSVLAGMQYKRLEGPSKSLPQPLALRGGPGVQDYAFLYRIEQAQTEQLLINARVVAGRMLGLRGPTEVPPALKAVRDGEGPPTDAELAAAIAQAWQRILRRNPYPDEAEQFAAFFRQDIERFGRHVGLENGLMVILLQPEALFRIELGDGKLDEQGRTKLTPRETAFAVAAAFNDFPPDKPLQKALDAGGLSSRDEIREQIDRYWSDYPLKNHSRVLRFFQEYFGYAASPDVFKDVKEIDDRLRPDLVTDTDMLVLHVLEQDRDVLATLLTTNESFVHFAAVKRHLESLRKPNPKHSTPPHPFHEKRNPINTLYNFTAEDWAPEQPFRLPKSERCGVLTQPSWLIAHSTNDANDAIHRGKWIRERLLGGAVPDTPITVEAQLPDEPEVTLRARMRVTREEFCWKCHERMDPLGLTFEMFDDWGRYRTTEKGKPVDASGAIVGSLDESLNGPVADAYELLHRLAKSEYVEQVFVRHAFRYWLGRNETPADAATLQEAHRAYRNGGGSMKALITALVTSDSFLYRTPLQSTMSAATKN